MIRVVVDRRWRAGVAYLAVLSLSAVLLVAAVATRPSRASAGGSDPSYSVYLATGSGVSQASSSSLEAGGAAPKSISGAAGDVSAIAINSTATSALEAVLPSGAAGEQVDLIDVRSGEVTASQSLPTSAEDVVSIAMDPQDAGTAYLLTAGSATAIYEVRISGSSLSPLEALTQLPATTVEPHSIAMSPDGNTLYAGWGNVDRSGIDAVPVSTPNDLVAWVAPRRVVISDISLSPDGTRLVAASGSGTGELIGLTLPLAVASKATWTTATTGYFPKVAVISPDGTTVYAGEANAAGTSSSIDAYDSATGTVTGQVTLPNSFLAVAGLVESPDESALVALGSGTLNAVPDSDAVAVNLGSAMTLGGVTPILAASDTSPQSVALTPDQAPVAQVAPASGVAGQPVSLSAAGSTVDYGTITNYEWNFGDGGTATTAGPSVSHTYASAGTYTVTVTETDSAQNSLRAPYVATEVNGDGQTPSLNASPSAEASGTVAVGASGTTKPTLPRSTTTVAPTTTTTAHPTTTTLARRTGLPTLVLSPNVGPPGTIVTVTGSGFPPDTPITVAWTVSTGSVVIVSDKNGNLPPSQMLILTPDILGPRLARTSSTPTAQASFLVVPSTSEPGGDQGSFLFRTEGP